MYCGLIVARLSVPFWLYLLCFFRYFIRWLLHSRLYFTNGWNIYCRCIKARKLNTMYIQMKRKKPHWIQQKKTTQHSCTDYRSQMPNNLISAVQQTISRYIEGECEETEEKTEKTTNKPNKFIKTKCNEIYVIAIEMKMEFLNNDGAHNLCEQDSNNFICIIHSPQCYRSFFFSLILMLCRSIFYFSRFVQNNYKF